MIEWLKKLYKPFVFAVLIAICALTVLFFVIWDQEKEKLSKQDFISQINYINNSIRESIVLSPDLKPNIDELPKSIKIYNKDYSLEYKNEYLLIKNFNDSSFCNKEIGAAKNQGLYANGNFSAINSVLFIKTFCMGGNMQVVYKKLGQ